MNRRWLIGVIVGMAATVCLPADAIVLRYAPKVGEVHKHKETLAGRAQTSMEGLGEIMRFEIAAQVEYSEKAVSQTDTLTRMQTDALGGSWTLTMEGQSESRDIGTGRTVLDLDRRGEVVKVVEVDMPEAQGMMGGGAEDFPNWSLCFAFSPDDIAVNGTWSGTASLPTGEGRPPQKLPYKCTLLDLTTFQGRNCAKIRVIFSGPFQMSIPEIAGAGADAEGSMNATIQGDLVCYYDYENSVHVYGEGSMGIDMVMSISGPMGPGVPDGAVTTKMLMNVKSALQP